MDHNHKHNQHQHHHNHSVPKQPEPLHDHTHLGHDNNDESASNQAHQHHAGTGHDKHAGHHTHDFLKRFWICLGLTIPILLLSEMIQHWFGFRIAFHEDQYVLFALGTILYFYGGMPFLKGMVSEIRHKSIGMMTLVALAITIAFVYSVAIIFGLEGMDFFWELATLIDIMLLGHWL